MFWGEQQSPWIRDTARKQILSSHGLDQTCNLHCENEIGFLAQIVYSFKRKKLIQIYSYDCFNLQAHSFSTGVLPLMIPLAFLLNMVRNILCWCPRGTQQNFIRGGSAPKSNPLNSLNFSFPPQGYNWTIWECFDVFPHLRFMKGWDFMRHGIEKSYWNMILVGLERVQLTHIILVETPNRWSFELS